MKIAILTTDNRQHFHDYAAVTPYFGTAPEALLQGFAEMPDVEIHVVSCAQTPLPSPEKIAPNIFIHGLHVSKIGWMRTLYSGCIRAIRRQLREIAPDLVHGQGTERECALAAVLSGYPNVVTLHGVMHEMASVLQVRPGSFYWLATKLENFALRRTAGVLCNSRFTEEKVVGRSRKTWRVPNAVQPAFFARALPPARPGRPVLLNVGTVCSYKRQNELLNVAEQLHAEGLDFELHFLGSASPADPYAREFLDRVQGRPYLRYHGLKPVDELISQYDGATALVHVSAVESFGLVVAEALARNLKFFGFKVGGVPDIAEGVEGAELFEEADWRGLKAAIAAWVRAGAQRPVSAAQTIRLRYHPQVIARRHLEIYREVLSTRT